MDVSARLAYAYRAVSNLCRPLYMDVQHEVNNTIHLANSHDRCENEFYTGVFAGTVTL